MSHEYAMSRVKDALEKSNGNHLKAQRLLLNWLEKDHTLLCGLVGPHMQGIIAHAVHHLAGAEADQKKRKSAPTRTAKKVSVGKEGTGEFGAAILESLKAGGSGGAVGFGEQPARGAVNKPGKASQKHIDAINKIARKTTDKKK